MARPDRLCFCISDQLRPVYLAGTRAKSCPLSGTPIFVPDTAILSGLNSTHLQSAAASPNECIGNSRSVLLLRALFEGAVAVGFKEHLQVGDPSGDLPAARSTPPSMPISSCIASGCRGSGNIRCSAGISSSLLIRL